MSLILSFVDFENAFVSVNQLTMLLALTKCRIDHQYMSLINMFRVLLKYGIQFLISKWNNFGGKPWHFLTSSQSYAATPPFLYKWIRNVLIASFERSWISITFRVKYFNNKFDSQKFLKMRILTDSGSAYIKILGLACSSDTPFPSNNPT